MIKELLNTRELSDYQIKTIFEQMEMPAIRIETIQKCCRVIYRRDIDTIEIIIKPKFYVLYLKDWLDELNCDRARLDNLPRVKFDGRVYI